jgi:hypothetical protein
MGAVLFALLGLGQTLAPVPSPSDRLTLSVRVYIGRGMERSLVEHAQTVARRLLAAAGIDMVWRLCDPSGACEPQARPAREVVVILSGQQLSDRSGNCGRALIGTRAAEGTVMVSLPCIADVVARIAAGGGTVHPLLVLARHDDVLGAVEAHELGHVLGLRHGDGLMRARLDPTGIVALRRGTLAFTAIESARMRTLLAPSAGDERVGQVR